MLVNYKLPNGETGQYNISNWLGKQLERIQKLIQGHDRDYVICVDGPERCLTKGSKVMMSDGSYKSIEDMKVGDMILSPQEDGTYLFSEVKQTHKWFSWENYNVTELNKRKRKLYTCSGNHQIPLNIKIKPRKDGKRPKELNKWVIKNYEASYYAKLGKGTKKDSTSITMPLIPFFKGRTNCEVEPYTLGAFLGDGHFCSSVKRIKNNKPEKEYREPYQKIMKSGKIVNVRGGYIKRKRCDYLRLTHREIGITSGDKEIIEEISNYYQFISKTKKKDSNCETFRYSMDGELAKQLIGYGLEGKGSGDKFIPKEALYSDVEYRKRLLAGLIDTDGTLSRSVGYSITTKSEQLAEDIKFLAYTLGGRARINKIRKGIKSINFIGDYFRVSFYLGDLRLPVKLKRKDRHKKNKIFFYKSANRVSIDVVKTEPGIVYGIEIDSPSQWFITDNYMVTHNSGKTTISCQVAYKVDPTFCQERLCLTPQEFIDAIINAKKGQAVVFDEAFTGLSSKRALSQVNNLVQELMMEMGKKNLFVIIVLPSVFYLEKYVALHRASALIHTYFSKGKPGQYLVYNRKKLKQLYLHGKKNMSYNYPTVRVKARFPNIHPVDWEAYEKRKISALKGKKPGTLAQKWKEQRDGFIFGLHQDYSMTYKEIKGLLKARNISLSEDSINKAINRMRNREENTEE